MRYSLQFPVVKLLAAAVMVVGAAGVARGQASPSVEPTQLLADQLVLQARMSVEGRSSPTEPQLTRAKILLEMATEVYGKDAETWLLRRDLAMALEDSAGALEALERYLELMPTDDAARLELIVGRAELEGQTVEERIARIARVLDGQGSEALGPALRSRLASHIAELAWNSGDMKTFGARLAQALRLDPETNLQAAHLMFQLASSRDATRPEQLGQAMLLVVRADPLNAEYRRELGHFLIRQAAYPVAAQQFNAAGRLATRKLDDATMNDWVISLGAVGATDAALRLLRTYEELLIFRETERQMLIEQGDPRLTGEGARGDVAEPPVVTPESLPDAGQVEQGEPGAAATRPVITESQLPINLEVLRLAMYEQSRDRILVDESFGWLERKVQAHIDAGESQAVEVLAWLSLLFDRNVEGAQRTVIALEDSAGGSPSAMVRRLRAWLDMRQGNGERAGKAFQAQAENDVYALLGMAKLMQPGTERAALLQRVIHREPASLAALLATFELRNQGAVARALPAGEILTEAMAKWPAVIEAPDPQAKRWTRLGASTDKHEYNYLDPIRATITIQNNSGVAMPIGPGGPIPSRPFLLLTPRQGGQAGGTLAPTVLNLNRRLRLEPREKLTVELNLTATRVGQFVFGYPNQRLSFDARAVLDPNYEPRTGMIVRTAVGDEVTMRALQRLPVPATEQAVTRWLNALNEPNREMLFRSLAQLAQLAPLLTGVEDQNAVQLGLKVIQAIEEKYPQLDPIAQAWTVAFISRTTEGQPGIPSVLDAARRSDDPLIRIVLLLSQVRDDPESPDLTAAMRHENPRIADFARAHRGAIIQRLAEQAAQ